MKRKQRCVACMCAPGGKWRFSYARDMMTKRRRSAGMNVKSQDNHDMVLSRFATDTPWTFPCVCMGRLWLSFSFLFFPFLTARARLLVNSRLFSNVCRSMRIGKSRWAAGTAILQVAESFRALSAAVPALGIQPFPPNGSAGTREGAN